MNQKEKLFEKISELTDEEKADFIDFVLKLDNQYNPMPVEPARQ